MVICHPLWQLSPNDSQGGPGATSLFGLFKENGPIQAFAVSDNLQEASASNSSQKCQNKAKRQAGFDWKDPLPFPLYDKHSPRSQLNRYSWNRNASVLYVDNPVGTGFSFTDAKEGFPNFVNQSSDELFIALQQFFQLLPEYQSRWLYDIYFCCCCCW